MDVFTPQRRSEIMARIKGKDTAPELAVRRLLHAMGFRFRLHRHDLPGKPDLVLPRWRTVILVHGCFWHGHRCKDGRRPKSNEGYWTPKLDRNRKRDVRTISALRRLGWRVVVIWACQTTDEPQLEKRLRRTLSQTETLSLRMGRGRANGGNQP